MDVNAAPTTLALVPTRHNPGPRSLSLVEPGGSATDRITVKHPSAAWTDPSYAEEELPRLIEEYKLWLEGRSEQTSAETIRKYVNSLNSFVKTLAEAGEPCTLASLTPSNVDRWVSVQRFRGLAPEGIASRQAAVKVFARKFVWLHLKLSKYDLLGENKRIKVAEPVKPMLDEDERKAILATFSRHTYNDVRDYAFVAVLLSTGLRYAEVLGMQLGGADKDGQFEVTAKGGQVRPVRMSPTALRAVKRWERERRAQEGVTALWTTDDGAPLSYWGGQSMFKRLKARSGVTRLHAHLFRHTFAQGALVKDAKAPVQNMLGHKTDRMTRRYTAGVRDQVAAAEMPKYALI